MSADHPICGQNVSQEEEEEEEELPNWEDVSRRGTVYFQEKVCFMVERVFSLFTIREPVKRDPGSILFPDLVESAILMKERHGS